MTGLDEAVAKARTDYRNAHLQSQRLHDDAVTVLPGGNTRSVLDFEPFPFRVVGIDGPYLVDADGHRYLDLLGNYSAGLLGHKSKLVQESIVQALESGWTAGAVRSTESELAKLVCDRFPSIEQVRFTNSGTEANLMAIATAQNFTERPTVMAFDHAYHGGLLYFGAGGRGLLVPHEWVAATYNDLDSVDAAIAEHGETIGCVIVEPMMAASGCIPGTTEFLDGLRDRASAIGAVLIFDEVMTSRLSIGGFQLQSGITPDMTTLGKYIAGGTSFGAFGGRRELMSAFDPHSGGSLTHGGTFNNNEISMSAGVTVMEELLTQDTLVDVNERGDRLRSSLNEVLVGAGLPMSVTGLGSLMTIHASPGPVRSPADLDAADDRLKELLFFSLLERGFYTARRGFIALSVDITDDHVEAFVEAVRTWSQETKALL